MNTSSVPWLSLLMLVPLVGAAIVAALPGRSSKTAKELALTFSLATLVLGVIAAAQAGSATGGSQFRLEEQHSWIPQFGVSYALGVDGIALALILMALVLTPVCILAAWRDVPDGGRRENTYFALLLVLETFMVGVFSATDVFLFYVFFEAMLIPVYFLIGLYGGPGRRAAAMKFLIFSLAGGLVMLVAVIALYLQGPGGADGFMLGKLTGLALGEGTERLLFVGFFIAFAVKAPMVPVHTWLPDAAAESTPATATLLVGVLDKVGTFGMMRFCLQLFPGASDWATPTVVVLAVVSVLYGAIMAIGQNDMMRLISYTSISHFGLIVLGIFSVTKMSWSGSTLYMVTHGFSTAALFLFAGMLIQRGGSPLIPAYGGWQRVTPVLAGVFLIAGLATVSLPGLAPFVSEFLVLAGSFGRHPLAAGLATTAVILAALYVFLFYKRTFTGPRPDGPQIARVTDLGMREKAVAAPLLLALVALGFYPKPALDLINPAVDTTLTSYVHATDPVPDHSAGAVEGSHQ